MSRKLLWSMAGVAGSLVAIVLYMGVPQVGPGTAGTVGAAQRYQAQQISAEDVTLADSEVQSFLQSDTFDKLIKDENTLKLLSDPAFQSALADAGFRAALADATFSQSLKAAQEKKKEAQFGAGGGPADAYLQMFGKASPKLHLALSSPEFAAALQNQAFQSALQQKGFVASLQSQQFATAASNLNLSKSNIN